ncbi:MAG: polysaccharide biosynthesis/export family protein, partial [Candidatus Omnitrophica bacterium]|nr:polysaccharide biosynthesis/export family protein [Candidatus Omnitrophota bacterium]
MKALFKTYIALSLLTALFSSQIFAQGFRDRGTRVMGWQFPIVGDSAQVQEYYLCIGDVLEISIWNHPNLTRKVRINPDGYLYYPLAG